MNSAAAKPEPENVIQIPTVSAPPQTQPRPRAAAREIAQPFRIITFKNASGTESYRVTGHTRSGQRIRENYAELVRAQARQTELALEWLEKKPETMARATKLTEDQLRAAEAIFLRVESPVEALTAIDHWLRHGKNAAVTDSPKLDKAHTEFLQWLDGPSCECRELTKLNLKRRLSVFVKSVPNTTIAGITPDAIDSYLGARNVSPKSRDNDRRAISRFFSWCMERPRKWIGMNPARKEKGRRNGSEHAPAILTLKECEAMLRKAETHKGGVMAPVVALSLFAGLRPFEAARITWAQVNLKDGEARLEANQTKTNRPRVIKICDTLRVWLEAFRHVPVYPEKNWRRDFRVIQEAAGFGTKTDKKPDLRPWPVDVMRHTAISHYFRNTGSYGLTAEQFGNSEAIIKAHYQGRVSSDDTEAFYALLPKGKARKQAKGKRGGKSRRADDHAR